ncbi:MAG: HDOD domain-containing protein [Rubrivivax sp.]|jgi:putative nucleotidyltransferase with HDIG domain
MTPSSPDLLDARCKEPVAPDRVTWLFRRFPPGQHPLRELILKAGNRPRIHTPQPTAQGAASLGPPSAEKLDEAEMVRRIRDLPPLPQALTEALRVVRRDDLRMASCIQAIEHDAVLAAGVLRLANSPFYGACGRVSTVGDAVRLLGLRTVAGVVVAVSMRQMLAQWRGREGQFQVHWAHAVATATAARELAPTACADPDEAFLAGLLHDLGRLAMAVFSPGSAGLAQRKARADDIDVGEAEARILGCRHDDIGAAVARHWQLPDSIVSAIALHHAPSPSVEPGSVRLETIVHVADAIAHALDLTGDPAEAVPPVDNDAWHSVCPSTDRMQAVFERVEAGVALLAPNH